MASRAFIYLAVDVQHAQTLLRKHSFNYGLASYLHLVSVVLAGFCLASHRNSQLYVSVQRSTQTVACGALHPPQSSSPGDLCTLLSPPPPHSSSLSVSVSINNTFLFPYSTNTAANNHNKTMSQLHSFHSCLQR